MIFNYQDTPGIAVLDSVSYEVKRQTQTIRDHWICFNGAVNAEKVICGDRENNRIIGFDRNNFSTFTALYGSFGSGTSNFNLIHEIAETGAGYLVSDLKNQRVKLHSSKNLAFIRQYGQLGNSATSYHQPTGLTGDESNFFIDSEASERLDKVDQSTFGIRLQIDLDQNTNSDSTLASDDKSVWIAYNKVSESDPEAQDVLVDVRDKGNLSLDKRFRILPMNVSTGSYQVMGTMSLWGKYFLVTFSNVETTGSNHFYFQKRLKSNGDIVSEFAGDNRFFSAMGFSPSYKPLIKTEQKNLKVEGRYLQLKFYDEDLENFWRVYNITPLSNVQTLTY